MLHAVIMAGGSGTRFWPASRANSPKQLLSLFGEQTLIQATVDRLGAMVPPSRVLVVTNERLVDAMREQLPQLPAASVIGEPCKRDTAPCIGLAAAWVARNDDEALMVVMPADHVIQPASAFQSAISFAADLVRKQPSRLVTFGIKPSYPAESFGYIERGARLTDASGSSDSPPAYQVAQFREKPQFEVARKYVESGDYYWNSGIFVWSARTILAALAEHEPAMHARLMKIAAAIDQPDFESVMGEEFAGIEGRSIDYAVMEKSSNVVVVEAPFGWDDVGSWQALMRLRPTDADGNTIIGRSICVNTTGSLIRSEGDHLVAALGLKDCIIVHTEQATLVASKHDEEQVREIVARLKQQGWEGYL